MRRAGETGLLRALERGRAVLGLEPRHSGGTVAEERLAMRHPNPQIGDNAEFSSVLSLAEREPLVTDVLATLKIHLADRYQLVRELGGGAMAHVFLATDTKHRRDVALKVLPPEVATGVRAERFLREIDTLAGFTHPHILPLYDSGRAGDLLWFTMPFVEGESLRSRLDREGPLPLPDALRIALECADGLAYAHDHGILHRDIKPANILLADGHAVLADFGIARAVEEATREPLTSEGVGLGTVGYMSPEQATGSGPVDGRSDLYSLGCVHYEMLTGERPFPGQTRMAVIARQISEPPTPASVLRPDIPAEVEQLVSRCLAMTPADRFASAAELRDALVALGSGDRDTGGRPVLVPAGDRRWIARLVGGLGTVAVVALIGWLVLPGVGPANTPRLDANRVVVFPLANRGGGEHAGADVALMIGNALLHTDPLSWIDGWEHLAPEQRGDPARVSSREARSIAIERGAGHYVTGGLAWTGDSITVRLVLHDTRGDSVVDQGSATGHATATSPDQLGLQAVIHLLPSLVDPSRSVDLAPITNRHPAAVALWIQGDRAYRSARFSDALELYQGAVELDSLLTLAALKSVWAANWTERPELGTELVRLALRHDTVLPEPYRVFARGLLAYQQGAADEAVAHYRAALNLDPELPEAWTALGETFRHLFATDAAAERFGVTAFREAERLDSTFTPALVHLAEAAIVDEDLDRARRLLHRLEEVGAEIDAVDWVLLMESCVAPPRSRDQLPPASSSSLIYASQQLAAGAKQLRCAETGFRNVLGRDELTRAEYWSAVVGLMGVLTVEDRVDELDSLLEESLATEGSTRFLFALAVNAGADLRDRAAAVDAQAAQIWGPDYQQTRAAETLWLLALWNSMEGDLPVARALIRRLEELVAGGDQLADVLARAATAHLRTAEGDTTTALRLLRGLDPSFPASILDYGLVQPLAPERVLLAELLLAGGEAEEAYRAAEILDHPGAAMFVPFVAKSLALRIRAAEALPGRHWAPRAREARQRLEALGRLDLLQRP